MMEKSERLRTLADRYRKVEMEAHYLALKGMNGSDPVSQVVRTCGFEDGAVAYAKRFLHEVFQDFPELRKIFPDYADQFGPYVIPS